jgi:hypothetical protein
VRVTIVPEPTEPEREAILAALAGAGEDGRGAWAQAALAEAVEVVPERLGRVPRLVRSAPDGLVGAP